MAKMAMLVLLVGMSVMDCQSYSLSKATPTLKGQDVGEPLADSDQGILPSDRSGVWTCALCMTGAVSDCPNASFKAGCPAVCSGSWKQEWCDDLEISDCANNDIKKICPCLCSGTK